MSDEEKPIDTTLPNSGSEIGRSDSEYPDSTVVLAELAAPDEFDNDSRSPPPIPAYLDNIAANGGAVAAIVLGIWSLCGAFISDWSVINAILGLVLGLWGLTSRRRTVAWLGILLCLLAIFLSVLHVSEIINGNLSASNQNPL